MLNRGYPYFDCTVVQCCSKPPFQSEATKMDFYSHANQTPHKKVFTLSLVLKVRVLRTRRWPIDLQLIKSRNGGRKMYTKQTILKLPASRFQEAIFPYYHLPNSSLKKKLRGRLASDRGKRKEERQLDVRDIISDNCQICQVQSALALFSRAATYFFQRNTLLMSRSWQTPGSLTLYRTTNAIFHAQTKLVVCRQN